MHHQHLQISKILQSHTDTDWQVCYTIKMITALLYVQYANGVQCGKKITHTCVYTVMFMILIPDYGDYL